MPTQTTGSFTFANWEERAVSGDEKGPRLAHGSVVNSFSGGIEAVGTTCEYTIAYVTGKTGTFTGFELLTGTLDGHAGTFLVEQRGSFAEDGTVHCTFEVTPGSGTDQLAGLSGAGSFIAKHGESSVPYTFTYDLS